MDTETKRIMGLVLTVALGVLTPCTALLGSPIIEGFDRYYTGSSPALPFSKVYAADYDAASETIWAAGGSGQIARLDRLTGDMEIVATVSEAGGIHSGSPYGPHTLYYDRALDKVIVRWDASVAVVDVSTGGYTVTELSTVKGNSTWYHYGSHTLFMGWAWIDHGLKSYNIETGMVLSKVTPPTEGITGSDSYLLVETSQGGVWLYDHFLNPVRCLPSQVFPSLDAGSSQFLSMTSDDLFAYAPIGQSNEYYVGRLSPDEVLYNVDNESYALAGANYQLQGSYYCPEEGTLYAKIISGNWHLLQIDLEGHEVARFSGPGHEVIRSVMRRGDSIVFYGDEGVFLSSQEVPGPATLSLLALGGLALIRRRRR